MLTVFYNSKQYSLRKNKGTQEISLSQSHTQGLCSTVENLKNNKGIILITYKLNQHGNTC